MNSKDFQKRVNDIVNGSGTAEDKERLLQAFTKDNVIDEGSTKRSEEQNPLLEAGKLGLNLYLINGVVALVIAGGTFLTLSGGTSFGLPIILFGGAVILLGVLVTK